MKVLHIVETLGTGAVESWLLRMLRWGREQGVPLDWTFYCALGSAGPRLDEASALGAQVRVSPVPITSKLAFMRALRAEVRRGKYDVVHAHHDLVSAVYLVACLGLPIVRRIVHVHNADEAVLTSNPLKQRLLRPLLRRICRTLSDAVIGISNYTLDAFLAGQPRATGDAVHYYGVDPSPFVDTAADGVAFRRAAGVPDTARVMLFLGRMVKEKNPLFAVEVLHALRQLDPGAVGIFVGSGSLDEPVRRRAVELRLGEAFRHLGWRHDVPQIMSCCDWFILPHPEHPMEGFGLVVVEAQLAGLRLLVSNGVTLEPLLPGACYERLSLRDGPRKWAEAALALSSRTAPSGAEAVSALAGSPMDMAYSFRHLLSLHGMPAPDSVCP